MKVFVDTGGLAALYYPQDSYHTSATAFWRRLIDERWQIYTTNYIIMETFTLLRVRSGHADACKFGEAFFSSSFSMRTVRATDAHDRQAWEIFRKYSDQDFSLVDCSSFVMMRELDISKAFTFDRHFSVMGFETLLQNPL